MSKNVYTRKSKAKKVYKSKKVPKVSIKSITKIVDQKITRMAEKKNLDANPVTYSWALGDNSIMSPAYGVTGLFGMLQGVAPGTRVGNQINITKATMNFNLTANSSTNTPMIVDIWFGYLKGDRGTVPSATDFQSFLQDGNAAVGVDQTTLSLLRSVNKDKFTVLLHKRLKIGKAIGNLTTTNTYANNDFPVFQNFKLSMKSLLGKMPYNDNTNVPNGKNIYMFCHNTAIDGVLKAVNECPILNFYMDGEYTDL